MYIVYCYVWHILFNHDYFQVKYQSLLLLYALGEWQNFYYILVFLNLYFNTSGIR